MMQRSPLAALVAIAGLVAACTVEQTRSPDTSEASDMGEKTPSLSRYTVEQDHAPIQGIVPQNVPDAEVRPDPILPLGNGSPYVIDGLSYTVLKEYENYSAQGIASWYGAKFSGHRTSNGELYDLYKPSAAHKSLPIPSFARVTNLENGRSIVVRVNDRGPFHEDRLIDLSYAAAVKLGYMEKGTARVEVEVIPVPGVQDRRDPIYGDYRFLQMGAFGDEALAAALRAELEPLLSAPVFVSPVDIGGRMLYRVRVGPVDDARHLVAVQQILDERGYQPGQPLP